MIDLKRSPGHRLVRVFLSRNEPITYEVYVSFMQDVENQYLCTCPGYGVRSTCKHVEHVQADESPYGNAALYLQSDRVIEWEEVVEVLQDPEAFRAWVLEHGRVSVL